MRTALDLVADRVAFESCVDEAKRWYWEDSTARERVMVEATKRLLNILTSGNPSTLLDSHTPWVDDMLDALQRVDALKLLEGDAFALPHALGASTSSSSPNTSSNAARFSPLT